jgi:hypothetical protein
MNAQLKEQSPPAVEYRGHTIRASRAWGDFAVRFPCGRRRYGSLESVKADVDAYLAGTLPPPTRGA